MLIKAYEILGSALDPSAQMTSKILTVKQLLTPLSGEDVKVVRCLGLNYPAHAVNINPRTVFHALNLASLE